MIFRHVAYKTHDYVKGQGHYVHYDMYYVGVLRTSSMTLSEVKLRGQRLTFCNLNLVQAS